MKIDIDKYSIEMSLVIFLGGIISTCIFYLPLYFLSYDSYIRGFFYSCW